MVIFTPAARWAAVVKIALQFCYIDHIYMQFSLLNSSDIKMVPQYCSYGSTGVPAVPATIFMSETEIVFT